MFLVVIPAYDVMDMDLLFPSATCSLMKCLSRFRRLLSVLICLTWLSTSCWIHFVTFVEVPVMGSV